MSSPRLCQIRASAGSGKTYTLTGLYIDKLAEAQPGRTAASHAKGILAITFTNAAANEMRDRVLGRLKLCALGQTHDMPKATAKAWLEVFLDDPAALNIRTIDSLLHQIIRASALDLGISPDYETIFSTEEALQPYIDLCLEEAEENPRLRETLRQACQAFIDGSKYDRFIAGDTIIKNLNAVLKLALKEQLVNTASIAQVNEFRTKLVSSLQEGAQKLLRLAPPETCNWKKKALKIIGDYANGILKDSEYRRKNSGAELFNKNAKIPPNFDNAYTQLKESANRCFFECAILDQAALYAACIDLAEYISSLFKDDLAKAAILPQLLAPGKAKSVLSPLGPVTNAFLRMGNRLTHFLVDEFQDTSEEQWAVLHALAHEACARGGSLLWVGDPKQSIYGWRGGKPELFDDIGHNQELLAVASEVSAQTLEHNWRSHTTIVEHTNQLFAPLADPQQARDILAEILSNKTSDPVKIAGGARIAGTYRDIRQNCKKQDLGYVRVKALEAADSAELKLLVLDELVRLLLEDIGPCRKWSDVLILTRSNAFAKEAAEKLIAASIPVITENGLLLNENSLVLQTIAFLAFLNDPADDLAFWAVINGSLLKKHPAAADLAEADIASLAAARGKRSLYSMFVEAFPAIAAQFIEPFYNQAAILTVYDTVMEWHRRLDSASRFPADSTMLRSFMETVFLAENAGCASLAAFLEYWQANSAQQKAPMPENMNAVRIMTIHKAKGLEAPIVIVPMTNFSISATNDPDIISLHGKNFVVKIRAALEEGYHEEMARQALEALNLLYVAITRPIEELYLFKTSTPACKTNNTAKALQKLTELSGLGNEYALGAKTHAKQSELAPPEEPDIGHCNPEQTFAADWFPMRWLPKLKIFRNNWRQRALTANERGILLHSALEHLAPDIQNRDACETALIAACRATGIMAPEAARKSLIDALRWFSTIKAARHWLEIGLPEHSFMLADGRLVRADLVVPLDNQPLVIDYKSGQHCQQHVTQMQTYMRALKESGQFPGEPLGLLIYLDLRKFCKVTLENGCPLSSELPYACATP